ncbi:MAG: aldo/keto reductase [Lentisphaerae bacterium]|nr:aldo/keto reductase [Lentisphaerota bacterium]
MRYRKLGRTGLSVSELGYGAARGAAADRAGFLTTVHAALDAGMNFIDTAAGYEDGACERALGEALQGRDAVIVETKYRPYDGWGGDAAYTGSPARLTASAEASLRNLRRDRLDILLGHGMRTVESFDRFMNDGCYEAMVRLRDQGKVRFIGISELSEADGTHEVLQHALPGGAFDVVMLTLNFLLQTAADTVLPLCAKQNTGTVVMMPLNQASKTSGLVNVPAALECVRRHAVQGHLPDEPHYTDPHLFDFLEPYSVPAAALRFVLAHPIGTCCVGARSPERIRANAAASDPPYLDAGRLERLRTLFGGIRSQVR